MKRKAFSLVELLIATAIVAILAAILFPAFRAAARASKVSNMPNLRKIALAAQSYGQDFDDRMPITINGKYRDLLNIDDNVLNSYGEKRTDAWPLILLPYVVDRTTYADPRRDDIWGIWSGPALATNDPGYVGTANTYRNQNRFPEFGYNYLFLSPLYIPSEDFSQANPTDYMVAESHGFFEADRPSRTVFYAVSNRGYVQTNSTDTLGTQDATRGHLAINPPGFWNVEAASTSPYVLFWNGTNCSGDWCGDTDPGNAELRTQNYAYIEPTLGGNNVAFLDAHVSFLSDVDMAAGTNYLTATPNGLYFGGGATVTDKSKFIWNLNSNFFGLY
jgi:prepilin-type N-terminal cleavage/methylation domain-containing protein